MLMVIARIKPVRPTTVETLEGESHMNTSHILMVWRID